MKLRHNNIISFILMSFINSFTHMMPDTEKNTHTYQLMHMHTHTLNLLNKVSSRVPI